MVRDTDPTKLWDHRRRGHHPESGVMLCGAAHPTASGVTCTLKSGHQYGHWSAFRGGLRWPI